MSFHAYVGCASRLAGSARRRKWKLTACDSLDGLCGRKHLVRVSQIVLLEGRAPRVTFLEFVSKIPGLAELVLPVYEMAPRD
jgi:hypothetical protein